MVTRAMTGGLRAVTVPDLSGVGRISVGNYSGSAALLADGLVMLTAAHLFDAGSSQTSVWFDTPAGKQQVQAGSVLRHPAYDADSLENDLALVWLATSAPVGSSRYGLYRQDDELGQDFVLAGYGLQGSGSSGAQWTGSLPGLSWAMNRFDITLDEISTVSSRAHAALLADFDDGQFVDDTLWRVAGVMDSGLGSQEGLIASGDSGGPALLAGKVAGVASFVASARAPDGSRTDLDSQINSSFGEIAAWQRVSAYQQWIDDSVQQHYAAAPARPEEVQTRVAEGQSGTTWAFFLVSLSNGQPLDHQASVAYRTRDDTALAGQDYLAQSGRLVLYPGQDHAVIAIEILGDTVHEDDEQFWVEIYDPQGADFPAGVEVLTVARIIVNDD